MTSTVFHIINKDLPFQINQPNKYELPPIIGTDKLQRKTIWKVWVDHDPVNDTIRIGSSSQISDNGKVSESFIEIKEGKNIGKKNETTILQQALLECHSKYIKKRDLSRSKDDEKAEEDESKPVLPMLAQKYEERKKYLTIPFAVSAKLDGVRMVSKATSSSVCNWGSLGIKLYSRTGKPFYNLQRIRSDLRVLYQCAGDNSLLFDGECYSHDNLSFNQISGCTRSKTISEYDDKMQYWIFDLIQEDIPYQDRMTLLKNLADAYHLKVPEHERTLKFVYYEIVNSHADVESFHTKYVSEGFEGLILRNLNGMYLVKNRSNDCQKYKHFQDEEYEICGYKAGRGTDENAIVFRCRTTEGGSEFDCRLRGSIEHRRELYKIGSTLIGKQLTVRYQEKDAVSGVPRFPVGICIRDYE